MSPSPPFVTELGIATDVVAFLLLAANLALLAWNIRRAWRDRAPFHRRLAVEARQLETRYDLRILDDRPADRDELIELLERRFPWFAISLHETEPWRPWPSVNQTSSEGVPDVT